MKNKSNNQTQVTNNWNSHANTNFSNDVVRNDKGQREHDSTTPINPDTKGSKKLFSTEG